MDPLGDDTTILSAVERRRQEFEAAWEAALSSSSAPPRIRDYLHGLPDDKVDTLFTELLRIEIHLQSAAGRPVNIDSYVQLFPEHEDLVRRVLGGVPTHTGAAPPPPSSLPKVPGFTLHRELGSGGQATVYLATQHQPPRRVALKVLPRDSGLSLAHRQRFQNEGQSAARLDHPNIARVWDCCYTDDPMYLVTEYVHGRTLREELELRQRWTPQRTATFLARAARAVQHAHERGIVHRDLKPANLLVTPNDEPKVIDFGVARRDTVETGHSLTAVMTQTGEILGSPPYMSPEQVEGLPNVGPPADVWALGVILFEMQTGEKPFRGATLAALFQRIRNDSPNWRLLRNQSPELELIGRKCLYKEPRDRYPSAAALADDLERFARGDTVRPQLLTPWESVGRWAGRNPRVAGLSSLLGVVLLLALAVTLFVYIRYSGQLETALQRARRGQYNVALLHAGALREREPWRVRELLARPEEFPDDLRDFVWGHHRAYCEADRLLVGHRNTVRSVAFSPDGRWLATADDDGVCQLWNGTTGEAIASFNPERGALRVTFVNDAVLACGGSDGIVELREIPSGKRQRVLAGRLNSKLLAIVALRDRLAAASSDEVRLWDLSRDEPPMKPFNGPVSALSLALTPKGDTLVVAGLGPGRGEGGAWGRLRFWDVAAKQEPPAIESSAVVRDVAFSPDGRLLAAACGDGTVRLFDPVARKELDAPRLHELGANCVAFAPDGRGFVSGSEAEGGTNDLEPTGWLRIWRLGAARETMAIPAHAFNVRCVAYHPSGRWMVSGGEQGDLRFIPLEGERGGGGFTAHAESIQALAFTADGTGLLTVSRDGTAKHWSVESQQLRRTLSGNQGPLYTIAVRPSGEPPLIATGGLDGTVKLWDAESGEAWATFEGRSEAVNALAFSADGRTLIVGDDNGEIHIWEVANRTLQRTFRAHEGAVNCLAFAADGRLFATGGSDGVRLWDASGNAVGRLPDFTDRVRTLAFSPYGGTLATGSANGPVRLWDVATRTERVLLRGQKGPARAVAFSPDGRTFAAVLGVVGQTGSVRFWDPVTGDERLTLPLPRGDVPNTLAFSPTNNGKLRLATAGDAGRVTFWEATHSLP